MAPGGEIGSIRDEGAVNFANALEALKERGSALLVVGSVPEEMYARASTQMLGDPRATPPRRRLLVTPAGDRNRQAERLEETGPVSYEWARLVTYDVPCRTARATTPSAPSGPMTSGHEALETLSVEASMSELGEAMSNVIADFQHASGGLESAEMRVAFDCLPAILSDANVETVFKFCHVLASQIRFTRGMGHFWLPKERTDRTVRTLEPLFDAVIELSLGERGLQQRWHFRDAPLVSDWLTLDG